MQSSAALTTDTSDTILQPRPHTGNIAVGKASESSPATTVAVADGDKSGGSSFTAVPEPPPHPSTKPEVLQLKDPAVKDFGWNSPPHAVPSPLVHGFSNEDLWVLVRRFNKVGVLIYRQQSFIKSALQQIFQVRTVEKVPGLLDLELSENEEFSPDKLRATLERFYMDVVCLFKVLIPSLF